MEGSWQTPAAFGASLAVLAASACGFDTSGLGTATGAGVGPGSPTSSSGELETSTGGSTGQAEADAEADGTSSLGEGPGDPSSSGADEGGDDTTTGPAIDPCANPAPVTFEIEAMQAMLFGPMQLGVSPSEGTYAYSEDANQGQASFEFSVPCQAEFRAWARVYDPGVGADGWSAADPDSYFVAFDGDDDSQWLYGCDTFDDALYGAVWAWVPLTARQSCLLDSDDFRRTLSPGTHLLHLTNREAGDHAMANVAAVARVVVTSDPAFVP
jgi:hypothetical protein